MNIKILNIDTITLGDRSYLVHDGTTALVVDPQRDIDRINNLLIEKNLKLGVVVETHIHNDYLSGGLELTREHGVPYVINKEDDVSFAHLSVTDQEVIDVGSFRIRALKTPGHTFTHLAYQLLDAKNKVTGIFTGGSLLHGATGRPDLLGWNNAYELAGLQHASARKLVDMLGDEVEVYPTHGFGSFCSSTPTLTDSSKIKDEKKSNPVLIQDKNSYVASTLAGLDVYPKYFKRMGAANQQGPRPIDLSVLDPLDSADIQDAINSGAWVVDLRHRISWTTNHILGSISCGIDGSFASYLGWLYPLEKDLYLISDVANDVTRAQRELVRIGIDRPTGSFVGQISNFVVKNSIKRVTFSDIPSALLNLNITILDVRQFHERNESYIETSLFIPFYEIESRVEELPTTSDIWVHCASGYRAALILKFIEASGRIPVLINDDYTAAAFVPGLTIKRRIAP